MDELVMDEIRIDNLEVYAYHGVFAQEQEKGQPFFVNMVLYTDTKKAGTMDDLTYSTHYGEVCHTIHEYMTNNTFLLIESVAEGVAREVLVTYPLVRRLEVEIRKPEAPIGLPFSSVSVKITRGWHTAYVALGSNLGNKEAYLMEAIRSLQDQKECRLIKQSTFYKTLPYGGVEQDDFLNGVICIETIHAPNELLTVLHSIEQDAKRERNIHWGPRTLDLDIIFYDDIVLDSENLVIPHKDMHNRDFVLKPLAEIAPFYRHPLLRKTVEELAAEIEK